MWLWNVLVLIGWLLLFVSLNDRLGRWLVMLVRF